MIATKIISWSPHDLSHCLDSVWLAWYTAAAAIGMLVWYCIIAWKWNESRQLASAGGRKVWGWLIVLFLVCSVAGYVSVGVLLFAPKTGAIIRVLALTAQNFVCPIFMYYASKYDFHLQGKYSAVGEEFLELSTNFKTMDDQQVSRAVRAMAGQLDARISLLEGKL